MANIIPPGNIAAAVVVPVIVILGVLGALVFFIYFRRHRHEKQRQTPEPEQFLELTPLSNVKVKDGGLVGSGNFGAVFIGEWNNSVVAMKKLNDKSKIEEFLSEALLLQKLRHPNIVQFFGVYNHPVHGYLLVRVTSSLVILCR